MKPSQYGALRALTGALVVVGGSLALLGYRLPGAGTMPEYRLPAGPSLCERFWGSDRDTEASNEGVGPETANRILKLFRNKNHSTVDLEVGDFIGGVENPNETQASTTFPSLKAMQKGCIWFWRHKVSATKYQQVAYFYHFNGGPPLQLKKRLLYCEHNTRDNRMKKPLWVPIPDDCEKLYVTVGAVTVSITAGPGVALAGRTLRSQIAGKLTAAGLSAPAAAAAAKAATDDYGPWYPCDPEGCCRAT